MTDAEWGNDVLEEDENTIELRGKKTFEMLTGHVNHRVHVVGYGAWGDWENATLECQDCEVVLFSCNTPRWGGAKLYSVKKEDWETLR